MLNCTHKSSQMINFPSQLWAIDCPIKPYSYVHIQHHQLRSSTAWSSELWWDWHRPNSREIEPSIITLIRSERSTAEVATKMVTAFLRSSSHEKWGLQKSCGVNLGRIAIYIQRKVFMSVFKEFTDLVTYLSSPDISLRAFLSLWRSEKGCPLIQQPLRMYCCRMKFATARGYK